MSQNRLAALCTDKIQISLTASQFSSLPPSFFFFVISVSLYWQVKAKCRKSLQTTCFFFVSLILSEAPPRRCSPDLMKSLSGLFVGFWVCVSACVCVQSCAYIQLSHFRNQLYFLWFGGDILTWSGRWCEVNLLLLCHVAAAGKLYERRKFLDSSAKQKTHSESNVKVKWLSAGKSFTLKCCKMTSCFSFFFVEISFNLKPLSKTLLLADRHRLCTLWIKFPLAGPFYFSSPDDCEERRQEADINVKLTFSLKLQIDNYSRPDRELGRLGNHLNLIFKMTLINFWPQGGRKNLKTVR